MIRLLLAFLLGLFPLSVLAQVTPQKYFSATLTTGPLRSQDLTALCKAKIADYNRNTTRAYNSERGTNPTGSGFCQFRWADAAPTASEVSAGSYTFVSCTTANPYFNPAVGCQATPHQEPEPDLCADKNEFIRRWDYPGSGLTPPPNHYGQCVITVVKMLVCRTEPSGVKYCMWLVKRTGEKYTGAPDDGGGNGSDAPDKPELPPANSPPIKPPPAPPGASPCPAGTVQAGVSDDGVPICMGQGSNPNNPPPPPPKSEVTKDETLPDGSIKKTTTTTTTNRDGSTTTNTQTTITRPSGATETSTDRNTSTNSAGQPGRMDTPNEDSNNLCKQNPNLSICRESSVSGTCGQITCVGDAIQCATLRAAAAMQCEQQADKEALQASPSKTLGEQVLSGSDPMKADIADALKGTEVDLSKTTLDQGGFVGGGACFPDKTFMVVGKPVTVSFARVCQDIQPLRAAVMACAFIIAYLIVGRSVVQG